MFTIKAPVESTTEIQTGIFLTKINCPQIAEIIKPGQFCNIKVSESDFPLLRRPFSICDVEGEMIYFMFNVHGEGTHLLAKKAKGDILDILGPLGNGFDLEGDYDTAVFAAGGIGSAPFPMMNRFLENKKKIISFTGGRKSSDVITYQMPNPLIATDDGSEGFKGNVIQLMESKIELLKSGKVRIFGCGPNAMLKALKDFSQRYDFDCQISTESAMACGFGICQGCPIEAENSDKYLLICKDGPVFNAKDVVL